jgi:hypothetical protein
LKWWRNNKAKAEKMNKKWRLSEQGRAARRKWDAARRGSDVAYKILQNTRHRIWRALRRGDKPFTTTELMGCTPSEYVAKLEAQLPPEWSWQNYGTMWEIDHIKPCALFDLTKPEQLKACFHFSNVRPLSTTENRSRKKWRVVSIAS